MYSNHRKARKQNTLKEHQNEICFFSPFIIGKCLESNGRHYMSAALHSHYVHMQIY